MPLYKLNFPKVYEEHGNNYVLQIILDTDEIASRKASLELGKGRLVSPADSAKIYQLITQYRSFDQAIKPKAQQLSFF